MAIGLDKCFMSTKIFCAERLRISQPPPLPQPQTGWICKACVVKSEHCMRFTKYNRCKLTVFKYVESNIW